MAKVLCVLYDDPVDGYPDTYPRDDLPGSPPIRAARRPHHRRRSTSHPGSCSAASRASSACGRFLEDAGHTLVVTSDKDGADSVFERELADADVVISQPFWPAYLTAERIAKAPNLKLAITAGIGSDHVDLQAAIDARHHRRRGHLLQQHQRLRARRHDDPGAGAQLHPVLRVGRQGWLEHRRLRRAVLRPRRHEGRDRGRRPDRPGRAAAAQAVRRQAALHRSAPPSPETSRRSWA